MSTKVEMNELVAQNKKAYDLIARKYAGDEPAEDDPMMRKACRDLFTSKLNGNKILEVGCGPGVDSGFFKSNGYTVTATDFSENFIQIVKERYPEIEAFQMDMTNPSLKGRKFDGIYAFASFLHVPREKSKETLSNLKSLLNEKGVLFLMLIESTKVSEYFIDNWGDEQNNRVLFTCYSKDEMLNLLKEVGFSKIEFYSKVAESKRYENMPRLDERGVEGYEVIASL